MAREDVLPGPLPLGQTSAGAGHKVFLKPLVSPLSVGTCGTDTDLEANGAFWSPAAASWLWDSGWALLLSLGHSFLVHKLQ